MVSDYTEICFAPGQDVPIDERERKSNANCGRKSSKPKSLKALETKGESEEESTFFDNNRYKLDANDLYCRGENYGYERLCSYLKVLALAKNETGTQWLLQIEYKDPDKRTHRDLLPLALLASPSDLARELAIRGVLLTGKNAKERLHDYLMIHPTERVTIVQSCGWFDRNFVFPNRTIGDATVIFHAENEPAAFEPHGSLLEWQQQVSRYCKGNQRLVLALCAAFAGPLMKFAGSRSFGIHLVGDSSDGKTTAFAVLPASVYGGPAWVNSWRSTDNAAEGFACERSDGILLLDEFGQVDPIVAAKIVYTIGNETGKARLDKTCNTRKVARWRVIFLSTGEVSLAHHLASVGGKVTAGQEVRLIELPSDTGTGYGVFEDLHQFKSAKDLAEHLDRAARSHFGTPGLAYIDKLVANFDTINERLLQLKKNFVDSLKLAPSASGQVHRVANQFALLSAAGELATEFGITGWPEGTATDSVKTCFEDWLRNRGTSGSLEDQQILECIRRFFEQHGRSYFDTMEPSTDGDTESKEAAKSATRAGFWSESKQQWYVFPSFLKNLTGRFLLSKVNKVLIQSGWLESAHETDGTRAAKKVHIPGKSSTRMYVFKKEAVFGSEPD